MRMKDGRTHLSYKAEHAVDLESDIVVAATVSPGNRGDADSLPETMSAAQANLEAIGSDEVIQDVVADRGYHAGPTLGGCMLDGLRTYVARPKTERRRWIDKSVIEKEAVTRNDRRIRGERGRRLQRERSEKVERSFAHICDTGGARQSWIRGLAEVTKRYIMTVAAHNLGRILFKLLGIGKPKRLQGLRAGLFALLAVTVAVLEVVRRLRASELIHWTQKLAISAHDPRGRRHLELSA